MVWAQSNMTKIRVGVVPVLDASAFFIAQEHGHFAAHRLEVEVTPTPGGGPSMAALVAGQFQFAMSTVTTMIQSALEGLDLRIVTGVSGAKPFPNDYSAIMWYARTLASNPERMRWGRPVPLICCRTCPGYAHGCGLIKPAGIRPR
jgi:hypothetical protein